MALSIPLNVNDARLEAGITHCATLFNEANRVPIVDGDGNPVLDGDGNPTYQPGLTDVEYATFIFGSAMESWAKQKEEYDFQLQVQALRDSQGQ